MLEIETTSLTQTDDSLKEIVKKGLKKATKNLTGDHDIKI